MNLRYDIVPLSSAPDRAALMKRRFIVKDVKEKR